MIALTFACGHHQDQDNPDVVPVCLTCGERRVQRVTAPAPRFVGVCKGPHATFKALDGIGVPLGAQESKHD